MGFSFSRVQVNKPDSTYPTGMSANLPMPNITATGATFTIPAFTVTVTQWAYKTNMTNDNNVHDDVSLSTYFSIGGVSGTAVNYSFSKSEVVVPVGSNWQSKAWTATASEKTLNTSSYFSSANKTSKQLTITPNGTGSGYWYLPIAQMSANISPTISGSATITLDVPPTVTLGTPIYSNPQYAGFGSYTIPITSAEAYYGGDISKVTLTVGQDSTVQTYSATTISNQTISVIPTIAGTYTPTIIVEDSRGQTKTEALPQITVNPYNVPSASFDVYRTNDIGIKNDEGHYALIQSTISYTDDATTLTEPSIQIDGVDLSSLTDASVTWYKTWNNTSGVSNVISDWTTLVPQNHIVTIYGLIDWDYDTTGKFAEDTSYQITLVANDSLNGHSTPITQTMSTAFYTIDFQAGGKEIAFGSPANDTLTQTQEEVGLFKCKMDALFENGFVVKNLIGEIKTYAGATVPTGWHLCDGSELAKADYPLLYNAIGDLWGTPTDSDHFVLPNLMGRVPVGCDEDDTDFDTVGNSGGTKDAIVPYHNHTQGQHRHNLGAYKYGSNYCASGNRSGMGQNSSATTTVYTSYDTPPATNYAGTQGNEVGANLQPYAVVNYIICCSV